MHADADGQRLSTRLGSNLDQAETYQQSQTTVEIS